MNTAKYYGISKGNGNDGVSQLFPDFIVKTNQPWLLAELAALSCFDNGKGRAWAKENMEIDGDEDYTISVVFMESPEQQKERNKAEEGEEGSTEGWDMTAWFIVEVFQADENQDEVSGNQRCQVYDSLSEAFDAKNILDVYGDDANWPMTSTWKRANGIVRCNPPFGKGFVRVN